jgi:uncharacterized membrane protein
MVYLILLLRIVHIFAGVFWVGAAIVTFAFFGPAARAVAAEDPRASQKFVQTVMGRQRLTTAMGAAAGLTMLAGIMLYGIDSGGFRLSWITSGVGLGFTIGALAAIASAFVGGVILQPTSSRIGALGAAMAERGGPPSAEQQAEMGRLSARMNSVGRINITLLLIALLGMATARYLVF